MLSILTTLLLVIVVGAIGLALWAVALYNGLVTDRNAYRNAFAQIDVQLTRRHDLIPNLVEVAKGYMQHERETLEAVIQARNAAVQGLQQAQGQAGEPAAMAQLANAENGLGSALGRLFALSESYPDLKANSNMAQLSEELASTENRVAFARQAYNDAVMSFNNRREVFPGNIVAATFHFQPAAQLGISAEEAHKREVPKVSFG